MHAFVPWQHGVEQCDHPTAFANLVALVAARRSPQAQRFGLIDDRIDHQSRLRSGTRRRIFDDALEPSLVQVRVDDSDVRHAVQRLAWDVSGGRMDVIYQLRRPIDTHVQSVREHAEHVVLVERAPVLQRLKVLVEVAVGPLRRGDVVVRVVHICLAFANQTRDRMVTIVFLMCGSDRHPRANQPVLGVVHLYDSFKIGDPYDTREHKLRKRAFCIRNSGSNPFGYLGDILRVRAHGQEVIQVDAYTV